MIDHKNKIIFIHLEKSGGSSLEHIFTGKDWWPVINSVLIKEKYDEGHEKHITFKYAKKLYEKEFKSYKKICVVRHPYSLFISKFNWYRKVKPKFLKNKNLITEVDIKKLINSNKNRWQIKYLHEFLGEPDNYDFIIRFENYKEDYYKMLEKFNLNKEKFKLKHIYNESINEAYKSLFLNDECKKIIKNYSYKYCEMFNYKCEI